MAFFYCNPAPVNGRLEDVGCYAALREFAARLIAPQFASQRWLLSILRARGMSNVLYQLIKQRLHGRTVPSFDKVPRPSDIGPGCDLI